MYAFSHKTDFVDIKKEWQYLIKSNTCPRISASDKACSRSEEIEKKHEPISSKLKPIYAQY